MTTRTSPRSSGPQSAKGLPANEFADEARVVNEHFRARRQPHEDCVLIALCECARRACLSGIELTVAEYDAIRRNSDWYIVAVGHEASYRHVVRSTDRYRLVAVARRTGLASVGALGSA